MDTEILIVAAGRGSRAGGGVPKQYRTLLGKPVVQHTIQACLLSDRLTKVTVVIHDDDAKLYENAVVSISDPRLAPPVIGGETRSQSVRNGLVGCSGSHVLIHDGARPLVSKHEIERLIDKLQTERAAFLAVPLVDALWKTTENQVQSLVPRGGMWRAKTPQGFRLEDIRAAHELTHDYGDDVEAALAHGIAAVAVQCSERNLKITHPEDFDLAEKLMTTIPDVRCGNGYDVHKFGPGDHVVLCGVEIPHNRGLVGHSDADVAMHTLTDAIFGALGEGDIGQWFPPSDDQWKGAQSDIFLIKAVERAAERGFTITHMDCTIICEEPKIGPHAQAMRTKLSEISGVSVDRISVKATTSEKLGFTGRAEGIAAQGSATLVKI